MKKTIFAVIFLGIISLSASKGFAQTKGAVTSIFLETAEWGQCKPYNKFCPSVGEDTTLSGSAATALATLLRYYEKPAQGTGTIPKYKTTTQKIPVPAIALKSFTYNYANMPLKLDSSTTDEQKDAIAKLIYHCGAAVKTDFRTDDTVTAYAENIINAMATYFKFSRTAVELNHDYYSDRVWFDMIKKEIDNGRPVLAIGKRESGEKYVFICDGYDSNSKVHVNWCWNGEDNGWFAVSEVHGYFVSDSAIFGLAPQAESESVELYLSQNIQEGYTGISLSGTDYIESGKPFNVKLGNILNAGTKTYNGTVKVSLLDRTGNIRQDISKEFSCSIAPGDSARYTVECKVSGTILGDHICAYYKLADGTWNRLGAQKYGFPQTIGDMGVFDAPFIVIPDNLEEGNVYYPTLVPGHKTPIVIGWTYDGEDLLDGFVTLSKGEHTISATIFYVPVSSTADWEKVGGEIVTKKIKVN